MVIGGGKVYPELNYTLPVMPCEPETWKDCINVYKEMTEGVCARAKDLETEGFTIEMEVLPPMTLNPKWGEEATKVVRDIMFEYEAKYNVKSLFRITPIDIREGNEVKHMYKGSHWDRILESFDLSCKAGADLLSIESIGGKDVFDEGCIMCDLPKTLFAYATQCCPDMDKLWTEIAKIAKNNGKIAAGDTACGFANTAMVLAEQNYIPRVFGAVMRVMAAVRSLVAMECGAVGPDKDCGYEGPYLKAIHGNPISMEGRMACGAHLSRVGNIAGALCDLWSNESIPNIKLLSGMAPTAGYEQLQYDCRMFNLAKEKGIGLQLRDVLVDSDSHLDPHGWILRPDVVLATSAEIIKEDTYYGRLKNAAAATVKSMRGAIDSGQLKVNQREIAYLDIMDEQLAAMPADVNKFSDEIIPTLEKYKPEMYV